MGLDSARLTVGLRDEVGDAEDGEVVGSGGGWSSLKSQSRGERLDDTNDSPPGLFGGLRRRFFFVADVDVDTLRR